MSAPRQRPWHHWSKIFSLRCYANFVSTTLTVLILLVQYITLKVSIYFIVTLYNPPSVGGLKTRQWQLPLHKNFFVSQELSFTQSWWVHGLHTREVLTGGFKFLVFIQDVSTVVWPITIALPPSAPASAGTLCGGIPYSGARRRLSLVPLSTAGEEWNWALSSKLCRAISHLVHMPSWRSQR
jgi:hypothetical protein